MNDELFNQIKEQVKDQVFSEGHFEIVKDGKILYQTKALLGIDGSIFPADWQVLEDAVYGFDGKNVERNYVSDGKKFECFSFNQTYLMMAIVPGITLPQEIETVLSEKASNLISFKIEELNEAETKFIKIYKEYLDAKNIKTTKLKI